MATKRSIELTVAAWQRNAAMHSALACTHLTCGYIKEAKYEQTVARHQYANAWRQLAKLLGIQESSGPPSA